jgi:hypothetical protein
VKVSVIATTIATSKDIVAANVCNRIISMEAIAEKSEGVIDAN